MNIQSIPYNNQLKKVAFSDIIFHTILLEEIPAPYFKDNTHHQSATARNHISYDTMGFRDSFLKNISNYCKHNVLKLFIITPKDAELPYDAFVYLANKEIMALQFENKGNLKLWMDIIFKNQYQKLAERKRSGLFKKQPELNPNPQGMLVLGKGQFSQKWVNSGMLVDEKPYNNTGAYVYKNAPKQYNEAKIAKEKQQYLKKYIDTNATNINPVQLQKLFHQLVTTKNLNPKAPKNNQKMYATFETLANYKFPEVLKELLNTHNGIENTGFLTAEEILNEWKNWKKIYDDPNWMLADLTQNNHPDGRKTIGMYTNPYWIPFLSTGGGNFIAIDYAPGSKGTSGQIIAFGADETKIGCISKSMQHFLEQLIDGKDVLNNGF